jgi:hypothetical protein
MGAAADRRRERAVRTARTIRDPFKPLNDITFLSKQALEPGENETKL